MGEIQARLTLIGGPIAGPPRAAGQPSAKVSRRLGSGMRLCLSFALILAATAVAAAEPPPTIEGLLAGGWEIAGYASGYDNRTSLILFRHPGVNALVQCGVLFDVTRNPHTLINCYELR